MNAVMDLSPIEIYEASATHLRGRVDMRRHAAFFEGHFPGVPILSGVRQLHWVVLLAKQHWYPQGIFSGVSRIKFQRPIQPEDLLEIELTHQGSGKCHYSYKVGAQVMSSGTFEFAHV